MVNGAGYLMDAGVGTLLRLNEAGFDPTVIKNVFVTHQHTDHNADLGNILGFGWTTTKVTSTTEHAMTLWGPPGTQDFVTGWEQSTALSNNDQVQYLGRTVSIQEFLTCNEFPLDGDILTQPVQIMSDTNVTVTAIRVSHGSMPSVGYRFRTPDLDVVFSGDRGPGNDPDDSGDVPDNFTSLAAGAQVMFHEIIDIQRVLASLSGAPQPYIDHMMYDHSDAEYVGATATATGVPRLVLYHLVPASPAITPDSRWLSLVQQYYRGQVVVGNDLQKFS
jgi:ribonuclease BN (tRNA processing enzyme)